MQRDDSSIYTNLSCCFLVEQYNKLQVFMHIVSEKIHGTVPGSLAFKEDRMKRESDRCIAVPVPGWFSKRTKISLLVCRWPCVLGFELFEFFVEAVFCIVCLKYELFGTESWVRLFKIP